MAIAVYIAGPYSSPEPAANLNRVIAVADRLLTLHYLPYVPHLTLLWQVASPKEYDTWLAYDQQWLERCDVVLRLPGDSPGADCEVAFAGRKGIPVVYSIEQLQREYPAHGRRNPDPARSA